MKKIIIVLVALAIPFSVFGYTAVLKNGKKIEGTLVSDDDGLLKIKDRDGVLISIKSSQIDSKATADANIHTAPAQAIPHGEGQSKDKTVADVAREYRSKKPAGSKVLTKEDLKDLPEISIMGSEDSEPYTTTPSPATDFAPGGRSEGEWIAQTRAFGQAIRQAEQDYAMLKKECDSAGAQAAYNLIDPTTYLFINGVWVPVSGYGPDPEVQRRAREICFQAERAENELRRLNTELENYQEHARRMGALPGWIEPDRVQ